MAGIVDALANLAVSGVGAFVGFNVTLRAQNHLQPHPFPWRFADLLEHPWRVQALDPGQTLDIHGLTAGMTVLDLGCGTGLFTRTAAHMVGENGRVHGVDLQAAMLERARKSLAEASVLERVALHHCGAYDLPLSDDEVDLAIVVSTLGEIPDKLAALNELRRVLKPGARLGVTDEFYNPSFTMPGTVRRLAEEAGFRSLGSASMAICYHQVYVNAK
ncbi:class I SAM-dependent methyltransferase [Caldilinea sp.]|uniref:class I SAM-dependent methyltransferase n=1 Tax=Caldilinea sp. TaxID=2293560 RepID=UPI0021DC234D|nr:class I SAM-dependent methyltransferase [Caldilinea sp.]GIV68375.1 MAG: hypothetical protein KatS3mg048_1237 [Caldilinea sp.]